MILDKTYIFINVVSWGVILQVKKKALILKMVIGGIYLNV